MEDSPLQGQQDLLRQPLPDWSLANLTYVLQGYYDIRTLGRLAGWSASFSCVTALIGLVYFSRRDV